MKNIIVILFLLNSIVAFSQKKEATQSGILLKYNGKEPKTAFPRVGITAEGAALTESDQFGKFELKFKNREIGQTIFGIRVDKPRYIIFNIDSINQWSIRKEPYKIILCDSMAFYKQKEQIKNATLGSYEREHKKNISQINSLKGSIEDKECQIKQLNAKYEKKVKALEKIVDQMARIDESELDKIGLELISYRDKGDFEGAINYIEKLDLDNKEKVNDEENKRIQELRMREVMFCILDGSKNNLLKAQKELKKNVEKDKANFNYLYEYASFCSEFNFSEEAILYYERILSLSELKMFTLPSQKTKGYIYLELGTLYNEINDDEKSLVYYKKSLNTWDEIYDDKNDYEYLSKLAKIQMEMGSMYEKRSYTKAENAFSESIRIYKNLYKEMPYVFSTDYAFSLSALGRLYSNNRSKYEEAEKLLTESVLIREKTYMADTTDIASKKDIAVVYHNIAQLYDRKNESQKSEIFYIKALNIERTLPAFYINDYIRTASNLGIIYKKQERYSDALNIYLEALSKTDSTMLSEKQTLFGNLGNLKRIEEKYEESEFYLNEALSLAKLLCKENPNYKDRMASTYKNLAILYKGTDNPINFVLCMEYIDESLKLYKELVLSQPQVYSEQLCSAYISFAKIKMYDKKTYKSYIHEAKKIAKRYDYKEKLNDIELIEGWYETYYK